MCRSFRIAQNLNLELSPLVRKIIRGAILQFFHLLRRFDIFFVRQWPILRLNREREKTTTTTATTTYASQYNKAWRLSTQNCSFPDLWALGALLVLNFCFCSLLRLRVALIHSSLGACSCICLVLALFADGRVSLMDSFKLAIDPFTFTSQYTIHEHMCVCVRCFFLFIFFSLSNVCMHMRVPQTRTIRYDFCCPGKGDR